MNRIVGRVLVAFGGLGLALLAAPVFADDASAERQTKQQGVLQIGEITIVGRVQKPIAAVDVAKIEPKLTLAELRQPFLDRIEEAVHKTPF
ncbi:MAG: hypothetical protein FWD17_05390 [Polyangiaceae bacterium]|nr:hypothetical protein [Polyangiaceae bacterium]